MIRKRRKHFNENVEGDLEILPMMNLFVVLIPMLLVSAVFLELAVIRMNLPSDETPENQSKKEALGLSIAILDEQYVVKGRNLKTMTVSRSDATSDDELREVLADVTGRFPDDHDVVIKSEAETRYDEIVNVMDVSRETGFYNVSLSGGAQ